MPKKENKERARLITIPVTIEDRERFKKQAKKRGMPMASWLRNLAYTDIARNDW